MRLGIKNTPKVRLEVDFKSFWDPIICEITFLTKTNLFETNYSKPLRQPQVDLLYRVYLKHRNSILEFGKVRNIRYRFCKITISLYVDVALRAASILETDDFLFVDVALRAASILKDCVFLWNSCMSSKSQNTFIWLDLSIGSMLDFLVLKNAVECTSQRLKWTSGARVMIIFGRSVARSLDWFFSKL